MPLAVVIEDNVDLLGLYTLCLELAGWTVGSATSVDTAIRLFRERKPDVVITDLAMPRADGFELVARTREVFPNQRIPIIVVTGQAGDLRHGRSADPVAACLVLEKPVPPDRLAAVAAAALLGCGVHCPGATNTTPEWNLRGCGLT